MNEEVEKTCVSEQGCDKAQSEVDSAIDDINHLLDTNGINLANLEKRLAPVMSQVDKDMSEKEKSSDPGVDAPIVASLKKIAKRIRSHDHREKRMLERLSV